MIDISLDALFGPSPVPIALDVALPRRPHKALKRDKVLEPVRPNVGLQAAYRKRLTGLLEEMDNSLRYWLGAAYKANPPEVKAIAQDELSSSALRAAMRKLARRWLKRFDTMADELAAYFAQSVSDRTDKQLKRILKDGGFSVEFQMSRAQRDVLNATVAENVSLIRSIPREYLLRVEGIVMRSVQTGRDMKQLSDDLQKAFGVSKRRAAIIARDQSNKSTAMLTRARHLELGITHARWQHSMGGKVPRKSHMKASQDKVVYDIQRGWFDPDAGQWIAPGQMINCRCVAVPIIRALA